MQIAHPSDRPWFLNAEFAGRYVIEREIARGGMATVFLADDLRHHRKVAVKVLRTEMTAAFASDRFAREIAIASQLNHPHILALYDSGELAGAAYYVMPYIEGESLRQKLRREGQLPIEVALTIARQIASALDYAHARGLVHRDVKPENILLHEGEAMVADFGIALAAGALVGGASSGDRITTAGVTLGTPEYMSPEQASGERDLDARSDLYSLGTVLYEMLAGEPPFTGANLQAVIAKRFVEPAPSVRRLRPGVPVPVERALLTALARNPADRFASCGAFMQACVHDAWSAPSGERAMPSVAVLPFLNMSADSTNEFFADGVTEDVIAQLSRIRSLKVISRTSAMRFKNREQGSREIASALGVATLLEGSVRRVDNRVRIVADLIDADSDRHLWAETYDRDLTDIFAIQTDVALHIAAALEAELSPAERTRIHREPTENVHAYQLYLQGRYWYSRYTEESIQKGIDYYRQAIEADPNYALPYAGLALAYAEIAVGQGGGQMRPGDAYRNAKEAIEMALARDNDSGEVHAALALLKFTHDFDWAGAEAEFRLALDLSPGAADIYDYYGWLCASLGRYDEALALVTRAQELDPLTHRSDVASTLLRAGRYQDALQMALQSMEFDPAYGRVYSTAGWAYMKLGDVPRGLTNLERAASGEPSNTLFLAQLGEAYGLSGRTDDARAVLRRLEEMSRERYVSPYHMAYVYTGLGEHDRAIDFLERAYEEHAGSVYGIKGSFLFTTLHSHPRFTALLGRMGLTIE